MRLEATVSPQDLGLGAEDASLDQPIRVSVKLTRMQEDVLAQGEARTTARLECSRCLDGMEVEIEGSFQALFVPETGGHGQRTGRWAFEHGDRGVNFYREGTIDLSDEIRQCLLIELPLKPLCRPECAGLCPQCGKNLNQGACDCEPGDDAGPWSALRDLIPPRQ